MGWQYYLKLLPAVLQHRMGTTTIYVTHDQAEAMTLGDQVAIINQGLSQQVSSPQQLYSQPANIFVAGFIDNPGMNICSAILQHDYHGRLTFPLGGQSIPIPSANTEHYQKLSQYLNRQIYVGMRPEAFTVGKTGPEGCEINGLVVAAEPLGHETLVYFDFSVESVVEINNSLVEPDNDNRPRQTMIARLSGYRPLPQGQKITLQLDRTAIYFFDSDGVGIY